MKREENGKIKKKHVPAKVFPPGEFLKEELEERNWTKEELSQKTGIPQQVIEDILNHKGEVTEEIASLLARALDEPEDYWVCLSRNYFERKKVIALEESNPCRCGGRVRHTGKVYYTAPAYYEMKCDECGRIKDIKEAPSIPVIECTEEELFKRHPEVRELYEKFPHLRRSESEKTSTES